MEPKNCYCACVSNGDIQGSIPCLPQLLDYQKKKKSFQLKQYWPSSIGVSAYKLSNNKSTQFSIIESLFVMNLKKIMPPAPPPPSSFTTKQEWTEASLFNTIENNSRKKSFKSWAPHQMSCQNLTFYTIATPTLNIGCKSPLTWLDTSPKTTPYVPWTIIVDYWPQSCPDWDLTILPPTTTLSL